MRAVKYQNFLSSHQLLTVLICVLSVACLGAIALINGFMPFSPSFFASHPVSAFSFYAILLICLYSFEMRRSHVSVRPYSTQDPQTYYQMYLISCALWSGGLLPICWLKIGRLALQGASIDELIFLNAKWIICTVIGAFIVYMLRHKALEEKDIGRVNRISPALPHSDIIFEVPPGWSHSDVWSAIPMTSDELQQISQRDKASYEKRRQNKLSRDTQAVHSLRYSGFVSAISASHSQDDQEEHKRSNEVIDAEGVLPSWLSDSAQNHTIDMSLDTDVRRSVNDFDTRFDQSVIPHHEILGENARWSGINRPAVKPKPIPKDVDSHRRSNSMTGTITQGFTPLSVGDTPSSEIEYNSDDQIRSSVSDWHQIDASEAPTTPPHGMTPIELEEPILNKKDPHLNRSDQHYLSNEDQALFDEVINVISETQVHMTGVTSPSSLSRMSYGKLSRLSNQKLEPLQVNLLNQTILDKETWLGEEE